MQWHQMTRVLTTLGLGALLTAGIGVGRIAGAASQASPRPYTGQVQAIRIDHCDLQPGTCEGSLVLAQAGGQEVALAMPAGITIERGTQHVHLEDLGIGNYVTVQAVPLAGTTGTVARDGGSQVGTNMGERTPSFQEATEE
jgi:hypothetical protein